MYLEEKIIRSFLSPLGSVFETIPIYVSVDFKKGKKSGIFPLVAIELIQDVFLHRL